MRPTHPEEPQSNALKLIARMIEGLSYRDMMRLVEALDSALARGHPGIAEGLLNACEEIAQ